MINFCPDCGNKLGQGKNFCGNCGKRLADDQNNISENTNANKDIVSENTKKDIVLGNTKKNKSKSLISAFYVVIIAGSLVFYFATSKTKEEKVISEQPKVTNEIQYPNARLDMQPLSVKVVEGQIILPLDKVLEKKFVRFVYKNATTSVPLLAYVNGNGKLITSISMCEPCNSTTFHISGDELICNSCGSTWDLNNLSTISGSCGKYPPDPIPSKVVGNEIHIDESVVLAWNRRV